VKAMEASAGVLKSLNKEVSGVENVENVVERLQEEMGKVDEVGKVLEEPLVPGAVVDEGKIDDELEAMEQEERKEREDTEAEVTRRRLQELEKQIAEKKMEQRVPDGSEDAQLEERYQKAEPDEH
jgi:charged multivesicular body protein 7